MPNLPKLTLSDVKNHFYDKYFERGLNYYNRGYIINPSSRGNIIEARCSGSMPNPYRVRATLGTAGIDSTDCSCPIGTGCKHAAALLLTWVNHPEKFEVRKTIDDRLEDLSKNELIFLIREMIKRDPDLETLLDLPHPGGKSRHQPIDPELYRRQVRSLFYGVHDGGSSFEVAYELSSIMNMANQFAEVEDWYNAKAVYQVIIEEGLDNYENAVHDEGEILSEIDCAVEGLAGCLQAFANDPTVRQEIMCCLFDVIRWDTDMGGVGIGEALPAILSEQANTHERQLLREWIKQEATKADGQEGFSRQWRKEAWGRMLLQLDEGEGDIDGFLERARAQGMYRPLFDKLVELGRVEEASEVATSYLRLPDYELLESAQTLDSAGFLAEAVAMVDGLVAEIEDTRLLAWLAEYYEARGDLHGALNLQLRRWENHPSLDDYQTLERISKSLNQWEPLRPRLLTGLAKNRGISVLARIHLYEENWEAAWQAATQQGKYYWQNNIQEEVARATEQHCPQRAIEYYLSRAEHLIAQRGRGNYAATAGYLQRVHNIYQSIGQMDAWEQMIAALREDNRNLPALQDELNKAGL